MFDRGSRVSTPSGNGIVIYRRMRGPDYSEVDVYSVKLDEPIPSDRPYTGTIFSAEEVKEFQP
jgi:hypothetical protein